MITYIIETEEGECYCGKTNDIKRRILEHMSEKRPHWFGIKKSRKCCHLRFMVDGDYEKNIKSFGVKKFLELYKKKKESLS